MIYQMHRILAATQDQNESFMNLIRKHCPKIDFLGLTSARNATVLSSLTFNKGLCSLAPLFERLGCKAGPYCLRYLVANDLSRLTNVQAKATEAAKRRRKSVHEAQKAREEWLLVRLLYLIEGMNVSM